MVLLQRPKLVLFLFLTAVWAVLVITTWAHWGNLTIDCGREAYVPAQLLAGKALYRDIWYLYTPGGPFLNSLLFRIFGTNLAILYVAGSVAALLSALATTFTAYRVCGAPAAYTVGLLLIIQSFNHTLFCFPFPYSAGAAYGAALTALTLFFGVATLMGQGRLTFFLMTLFSALAWVMKMEMGSVCLLLSASVMVIRAVCFRNFRSVTVDALLSLPAIMIVAGTWAWMVRQGGFDFLVRENLMSWPGSYFMRTYGTHYMKMTGWDPSLRTVAVSIAWSALFVIFWLAVGSLAHFSQKRYAANDATSLWYLVFLAICLLCLFNQSALRVTRQLLLPKATIVISLCCAAVFLKRLVLRRDRLEGAKLFVCIMGALVGARIFFSLELLGYSIFYNNVALCALMLAFDLFMVRDHRLNPTLRAWPYAGAAILALLVLATANSRLNHDSYGATPDLLHTSFGDNFTSRYKAAIYSQLITFMQQTHREGDTVMVMPEDTSLYFLSGLAAPTRIFAFTPGLIAPGSMSDQVIQSIRSQNIRYILLSSRSFPEYGSPKFGVDFDQPIWTFVQTHYRLLRSFVAPLPDPQWRVEAWERFQ